jgi:putative membrane protein
MWGEHEGMGWWMLFGSIWFVVFWGLIIWAIVTVVGRGGERRSSGGGAETPIEIARRRYAQGEINREQFEQIRRDLGG